MQPLRSLRRTGVVVLGLLSGCATWKSVPQGDGEGYDVYRPEPYMLIVRGSIATDAAPASPTQGATKETTGSKKTGDSKDLVGGETTKTTEPQYTAKIIYLPNYSQHYRISTSNFLGNANFTFTIKDGWQLTGISDQSDNTKLTDTAITTVGSLLTAMVKPDGKSDSKSNGSTFLPTTIPANSDLIEPGKTFALYKFAFDPDSGTCVGLIPMKPLSENVYDSAYNLTVGRPPPPDEEKKAAYKIRIASPASKPNS